MHCISCLSEESSTETKNTEEKTGLDRERARSTHGDGGLRRAGGGGRLRLGSRVSSRRISRGGVEVSGRVDLGRGGVVDGVAVDAAVDAVDTAGGVDVDGAGGGRGARRGGRRDVERALRVGRVALGQSDGGREVLGAGAVRGDLGRVSSRGDAAGESEDAENAHVDGLRWTWALRLECRLRRDVLEHNGLCRSEERRVGKECRN